VLVCLAGDDLTQGEQLERLLGVQRGGGVLDLHPVVVVVRAVVGPVEDDVVPAAEEVQPGDRGQQRELACQDLRGCGDLRKSAHESPPCRTSRRRDT